MKKVVYIFAVSILLYGCPPKLNDQAEYVPVTATIDLVNVTDDKVAVEIDPGRFSEESTTFYIPKTVPGTYSTDNYGQYIENFKALDYDGNALQVTKLDENSWQIDNARQLDKITYKG